MVPKPEASQVLTACPTPPTALAGATSPVIVRPRARHLQPVESSVRLLTQQLIISDEDAGRPLASTDTDTEPSELRRVPWGALGAALFRRGTHGTAFSAFLERTRWPEKNRSGMRTEKWMVAHVSQDDRITWWSLYPQDLSSRRVLCRGPFSRCWLTLEVFAEGHCSEEGNYPSAFVGRLA